MASSRIPTFRISVTSRTAGDPSLGVPEGFQVYNLQNSKTWTSTSGVWVETDNMSANTINSWYGLPISGGGGGGSTPTLSNLTNPDLSTLTNPDVQNLQN